MSEKETQARQPVAFTVGAEHYALSDQAGAQARRQAADTADLVAQVAGWMRLIADIRRAQRISANLRFMGAVTDCAV